MNTRETTGYISREFTVWCACGAHWYQTGAANDMRGAIREFRARGWSKSKTRGWRAPSCKKAIK